MSAVIEGANPLADAAMPEKESVETVTDGAVSEQVTVDGASFADERSAIDRSLIVSADGDGGSVVGESVDEGVAEIALPEPVSTETVVRDVLVRDYKWFWSTDDTGTFERVAEILDGSALGDDPLTDTAGRVRAVLWQSRHVNGGPSAAATCSIFHALGRQDELGWVAREAYLYAIGL